MQYLGFSSGTLYEKIYPASSEIIERCRQLGCEAIELQSGYPDRIASLLENVKAEKLEGFRYVSMHGPGIARNQLNEKDIKDLLNDLQTLCERFNVSTVVFHPDQVEDWSIFRNYKIPVAIENMDWRKDFGKSVEDVKQVIDKTGCGFVLDINHCFTNDNTMKLADDFLEQLGDKLVEVHLSGFEKLHEPLCRTKQDDLIEIVRDLDVPIIIESECDSLEEMKKEYEYIKQRLKNK